MPPERPEEGTPADCWNWGKWGLKVYNWKGSFHGCMDEGTLKTLTPLWRFHWSFCLGWWSNLVGSASGQKQSVKFLQNMVYTAQFTPHPPPSQKLTVCINSTFSLGREGGGQRENRGATVHKYSSFVHGGKSSQAGSKIPTNEWMYFHSIKSVKHNAAMFVNRSILKKSRHIGIGLLQCNLSTHGWFIIGSSCQYNRFLSSLGCSSQPRYNILFSSPPHHPATWAGNRAGSPVAVSLRAT